MPRRKRPVAPDKATMSLDPRIWRPFKTCCAAMKTPPGQAVDSLMLAWLRANAPEILREVEAEIQQET